MKSGRKKHTPYPYGDKHSMQTYSQTGVHHNMFRNKKAYKLYQENKLYEAERLLQNAQSDFDISILATIYYRTHRYEQAAKLFKHAIALNPSNHFHYNNLGAVYKDTNQPLLAKQCFESALSLNDNFAEAFFNLASCYQLDGDFNQAEQYFKQAIAIQPNMTVAMNNLACIHLDRGQVEKAIYAFDDVIFREPTNYHIFSNRLFALNYLNLNDQFVFEEHKKYYEQYKTNSLSLVRQTNKLNQNNKNNQTNQIDQASQIKQPANYIQESYVEEYINNYKINQNTNNQEIKNSLSTSQIYYEVYTELNPDSYKKLSNKKIKIAYISPDFRLHSVAYFIYPVIKFHDKSKFEIYCYSDIANEDQVSKLIQQNSIYKNIYRLSNDQVVDLIKKDQIDILIDLAGHSAHNRLPVFIQNPAPHQITYIGYPNTTGIPDIKYKITDNFVDPVEFASDTLYTEKLIRLNHIFLNYYPGYPEPNTNITPPIVINKFATYGSFNNRAKINKTLLDLWAYILEHDKNSQLILKSSINSDEYKQQSILSEFESRNIDPSRIVIYPYLSFNDHIDLYKKIDIALDTFPYSGTTTTAEALWSGVPVVSILGATHKSRVSCDILNSINMQACISLSPEDYVNRAISLAHNIDILTKWRKSCQNLMLNSSFMNYQSHVHNLETVYINIFNQDI